MADVFGLSDVSSPDTGRGKVLKTGGTRRKYNMKLKKCVSKKADLDKDGKISGYENKRSSAIEKAMRKK